jgi:hypothetical protein
MKVEKGVHAACLDEMKNPHIILIGDLKENMRMYIFICFIYV